MSTDPFTEVDPFEANVLDEQTELRAMTRALSFAEGFGLIFARCNQPNLRARLISEIKKELPEIKVREIHFTEPVPHLLDALRDRLTDDSIDAVFVSGLEYSLPVAAEAHLTPFVANLNASRNSFPNALGRPLVLWVPEYVLTAIIRGAPDFFSIRSGVYSFAATPDETAGLASSLLSGGAISIIDLTQEEKRGRIAAIESLLTDYETLPAARRNLLAEQSLQLRLGNIFYSIAEYSAAQQHYSRVLEIARATASKDSEAAALTGLGNIKFEQMQLDQASFLFKASVDIYRQTENSINEAI
ncbi:MAG TPA: tetratricopeptide repeat protein, partial [Blastocatellia bacterium]|nr:tetratricopeptide repeat protein [Blastocatellia bacterium]